MTYGAEIDESIRETSNWVAHLGRFFGAEVINEAVGGSSNDRIVRTTMQYIAKYVCDGKDTSDLIVTIGWSNPGRREFAWADPVKQKQEGGLYFQIVPTWRPPSLAKIHDYYYENLHSTREAEVRFLIDVLTLQNMLKINNIRYLFCRGIPSFRNHQDVVHDEVASLEGMIDKTRFHDFNQNSSLLIKANEWKLPIGPGLHPLEEAHQRWAETLWEFVQKGNI